MPGERPLRVVHLAAHDGRGGAARAMRRLHAGLDAVGVDSRVVVRERFSNDPSITTVRGPADGSLPGDRPWRSECDRFSDDRTTIGRRLLDELPRADVYNLHWAARLVDWGAALPELARRAPVVWTLSDMNPITGGCHYDLGCGAFRDRCGPCPQIEDPASPDLVREIFERKQRALADIPTGRLRLVAGSSWLAEQIAESALGAGLPVSVVPRAVDPETFGPRDPGEARRQLGIDERERVVLFVSTNLASRRKGLHDAIAAVRIVAAELPGVRLVCVGLGPCGEAGDVPILEVGHVVDDDRMAGLLSAADVMVAPSQQEAFGLSVLESLACGTPVVAYDTGGARDLVKPGVHGYVVPVGDVPRLGRALRAIVRDDDGRRRMGRACRKLVVEGYGIEHQARRYARIYRSLLDAEALGRPA